ncbi:hypothetical protein HY993_00885 [Candidatus Micrarchaeota archaeon]|nr:hypothetical protein [Candidatus Micrarchaeota archaeon]
MKTIFSQKPASAFNNALFVAFEQRLLAAKESFSPTEWALAVLPAVYGPSAADYLFKEFFSSKNLLEEKGLLAVLGERQKASVSENSFAAPLNKLTFLNSLDLVGAWARKFSFARQDEQTIALSAITRAKARFFDVSQAGLI